MTSAQIEEEVDIHIAELGIDRELTSTELEEWRENEVARRLFIFEHREMRNLLLRIHSARVGMNEAAVIAALNDVDRFFAEPNYN